MKHLYYLLLASFFLIHHFSFSQDYRGENKVFLKLDTFKDGFLLYESDKMTIDINEEQSTFDLAVDMQSFKPINEKATMDVWNTLFQEEYHAELSYKADFPIMKLDAQSDNKQTLEINGTFFLGEGKLPYPLKIEWIQMDRFVFVDFTTKISLVKLNIEVPEAYKNLLTGVIYLEVLNGKLIAGFR